MAVLRMGYVHARVTDLAEAKQHYANTLGLHLTREEPGKLFFKGWDEWDHHSVVLEEGGVGVVKFGFKVFDPAELDLYEARAQRLGYPVERMSSGDNAEVSDGIRFILPGLERHPARGRHLLDGRRLDRHRPDPARHHPRRDDLLLRPGR
jgi:catechol 2,3-dioxygenase